MGLFKDSLKKWFYTNNSSAASSDARVPLLNADGTPKGSDTMANLASVLGGITTPISQNGNIDNYRNYGKFTCASGTLASTLTGLPSGYSGGGFILFVFPSSQPDNGFRIQLIINYRSVDVYIRAYQSNVWEGWRRIAINAV